MSALFTKHPKLPALNNGSSGDAFSIVASAARGLRRRAGVVRRGLVGARATYSSARTSTEDNAGVANGTAGPATPDQADDGVIFKPLRTNQTTYTADLQLAGTSKAGRACAWIDLNGNGTFDSGERACAPFAAKQAPVTLSWAELAPKAGASYARVRVGYTGAQIEKPTGAADAGEVEDYPFAITPPPPPVADRRRRDDRFQHGGRRTGARQRQAGRPEYAARARDPLPRRRRQVRADGERRRPGASTSPSPTARSASSRCRASSVRPSRLPIALPTATVRRPPPS